MSDNKNDNKYSQAANVPPPVFLNEKERQFVKSINMEIQERLLSQQILYYPIDKKSTNFHALYGEAINKTFLPPIQIFAMVEFNNEETESPSSIGIDKINTITINFHKRRLNEDKDLEVQVGDFVRYGDYYYEIVQLKTPRKLFGQVEHTFEVTALCIRTREGNFDSK